VAQVLDADGGQIDLRPDIFPRMLDVKKRRAFGLDRKYPFAIFGHTQPDCVQQRGGGSVDRCAMQAALLRGGRRLDPDGSFEVELISTRRFGRALSAIDSRPILSVSPSRCFR
jgi:hypothetical protein